MGSLREVLDTVKNRRTWWRHLEKPWSLAVVIGECVAALEEYTKTGTKVPLRKAAEEQRRVLKAMTRDRKGNLAPIFQRSPEFRFLLAIAETLIVVMEELHRKHRKKT